jgi:hypothetical protein
MGTLLLAHDNTWREVLTTRRPVPAPRSRVHRAAELTAACAGDPLSIGHVAREVGLSTRAHRDRSAAVARDFRTTSSAALRKGRCAAVDQPAGRRTVGRCRGRMDRRSRCSVEIWSFTQDTLRVPSIRHSTA